MIGDIGFGEMMVIFLIILMLFGSDRLPSLARSLGKGIREFKRIVNNANSEIQRAIDVEGQPQPRRSVPVLPPESNETPRSPETTDPKQAL